MAVVVEGKLKVYEMQSVRSPGCLFSWVFFSEFCMLRSLTTQIRLSRIEDCTLSKDIGGSEEKRQRDLQVSSVSICSIFGGPRHIGSGLAEYRRLRIVVPVLM